MKKQLKEDTWEQTFWCVLLGTLSLLGLWYGFEGNAPGLAAVSAFIFMFAACIWGDLISKLERNSKLAAKEQDALDILKKSIEYTLFTIHRGDGTQWVAAERGPERFFIPIKQDREHYFRDAECVFGHQLDIIIDEQEGPVVIGKKECYSLEKDNQL